MNSWRNELGGALSLISENLTNVSMSTSLSTPSSLSGDEGFEKTQAIPSSLIKEQWQLVLNSDACIQDLQFAIKRCKDLVLETDECSEERKWLVRHLVELRLYLKELEDAAEDSNQNKPTGKVLLGHHFVKKSLRAGLSNNKQYCDQCSGIIWSVVQSAYVCIDCNYIVHHKCVDYIIRICAHVIASERKYPINDICPEIGLAVQGYKCAECQINLNFKNNWIEPRLCDYNGLYYCSSCHWNDSSVIPARIVHNWDFVPRKVCRASLQEINLLMEKPVINLEEANSKLFIFLQKLNSIKKFRGNLILMKKYLSECRNAIDSKLIEHHVASRRHLIQYVDLYSVADLIQSESGILSEFINKIYIIFEMHIRKCDICSGKAYICEICGNNEVLYPFEDGSVPCNKCNSIYHRACWTRKNMTCVKCHRLEERKLQLMISEQNKEDKPS